MAGEPGLLRLAGWGDVQVHMDGLTHVGPGRMCAKETCLVAFSVPVDPGLLFSSGFEFLDGSLALVAFLHCAVPRARRRGGRGHARSVGGAAVAGAFDPCPALPLARRAGPPACCRLPVLPRPGWAAPDAQI
jgi:hypothetical protein